VGDPVILRVVSLAVLVACSGPQEDDRSTSPRTVPIAPSATPTCGSVGSTTPPSPVVQLVAGALHTCARLGDRSVWCWGARGQGLIDGDVIGSRPCPIATRVAELADATKLVGSCALRADDTMRCGDVERGRFDSPVPVPDAVRGVDEEIATPTTTCRRRGATVSCTNEGADVTLDDHARRIARAERGGWWIVRDDGVLVRRDLCPTSAKPGCMNSIEERANVLDVATGDRLECLVDGKGDVWCKDERASAPQAARGTPPAFAKMEGVRGATQIAVGKRHVCVLAGNAVVCWGNNSCGQSGGDTMSIERCGSPDVLPTTIRWAK